MLVNAERCSSPHRRSWPTPALAQQRHGAGDDHRHDHDEDHDDDHDEDHDDDQGYDDHMSNIRVERMNSYDLLQPTRAIKVK